MSYTSVTPLSGAAPYLGGKRQLADRIIDRIEQIPHECYAEPFIGMGGGFCSTATLERAVFRCWN